MMKYYHKKKHEIAFYSYFLLHILSSKSKAIQSEGNHKEYIYDKNVNLTKTLPSNIIVIIYQ